MSVLLYVRSELALDQAVKVLHKSHYQGNGGTTDYGEEDEAPGDTILAGTPPEGQERPALVCFLSVV